MLGSGVDPAVLSLSEELPGEVVLCTMSGVQAPGPCPLSRSLGQIGVIFSVNPGVDPGLRQPGVCEDTSLSVRLKPDVSNLVPFGSFQVSQILGKTF